MTFDLRAQGNRLGSKKRFDFTHALDMPGRPDHAESGMSGLKLFHNRQKFFFFPFARASHNESQEFLLCSRMTVGAQGERQIVLKVSRDMDKLCGTPRSVNREASSC